MRFKIVRRDGFRCQYCGRLPPDVILRVDHVVALAHGGSNDEDNLVTACHDCNAGKGSAPLALSESPVDVDVRLLETQQKLAELRRYREAKTALAAELTATTQEVRDYWASRISEEWSPTDDDFRYLLDDHDPPEIEKAIWIASRRAHGQPPDYWSYTLAVLRNWRRDGEGRRSQGQPSKAEPSDD